MTPEEATALRMPFPPESIGKLPKPLKARDEDKGKCEQGSRYSADGHYCGGWHARSLHLDFVGHAATTDRLLTVDPEWSWEPFAVDPATGLPMFDANRNLWIKLTVCGVTRNGVGDGSSIKECIGDAIRNAAMRFGVALDLWAKEDLVEFERAAWARSHAAAATTTPVDQPQASAPTVRTMSRRPVAVDEPITEAQLGMLMASFRAVGVEDREDRLQYVRARTRDDITSSKDLTKREASKVIDDLRAQASAQ